MKIAISTLSSEEGFALSSLGLETYFRKSHNDLFGYAIHQDATGRAFYKKVDLKTADRENVDAYSADDLGDGEIEDSMNTQDSFFNFAFWLHHVLYPKKGFRTSPSLIETIEELGDAASRDGCAIKVIEIPDGSSFTTVPYDGCELLVWSTAPLWCGYAQMLQELEEKPKKS